jgi:hypothetical protein
MKSTILTLLLAALALAACDSLGDIGDHRVDPGGPYRPQPDPVQAR